MQSAQTLSYSLSYKQEILHRVIDNLHFLCALSDSDFKDLISSEGFPFNHGQLCALTALFSGMVGDNVNQSSGNLARSPAAPLSEVGQEGNQSEVGVPVYPCEACDGTGLEDDSSAYPSPGSLDYIDCTVCGGSGFREDNQSAHECRNTPDCLCLKCFEQLAQGGNK
jgi:hypothetical protein